MSAFKVRFWSVCLVMLCIHIQQAYTQPSSIIKKEIIFSQLPLELGLSQNSINCIIQDREGFLWIGTWSGLIRYDGYTSIVYHADAKPGKIKSDKITTLFEDHEGYIWVGTQVEGIFRFDKGSEKFTQFKNVADQKNSLSNSNVWCIREDAANRLWIGTENGLNLFNRDKNDFSIFYHNAFDSTSISHNHITDMLLSKADNTFWIGTTNGLNCLLHFSDTHGPAFKKYLSNNDYLDKDPAATNYVYKISELAVAGKSTIWFVTSRGLKKITEGAVETFKVEGKQESYNSMGCLLTVAGNNPFIITGSGKGLNFFDPIKNKFTKFLSVDDDYLHLSHASVSVLFIDRGGVLWVGTKKGLNKLDTYGKNFESFNTSDFDKTRSIVTGVRGSYKGWYWISTLGGGLYQFRDKGFLRAKLTDGKGSDFSNFIQTMYTTRDGKVYLGTAGEGVYEFDERDFNSLTGEVKKFIHYDTHTSPAIGSDFIMSITEDNLGNVWVGHWQGGLDKIMPSGYVKAFRDPLLVNAPLVSLYADRTGILWIGTRGNGVYKIKDVDSELSIRRFYSTDKPIGNLTNNFVNVIYEDHNGLLWVGTEGGLLSFDARTEIFRPLKFINESALNIVTSVQEDNNGKLWIASPDGLRVVDPYNLKYDKKYDYHDRIQGGFFYNNVSFKDEAGRLLFGGSEGFNIIEPGEVLQNPTIPQVVISDFQVFGKSILYGSEEKGRTILHKPLSQTKEIDLRAKENSIAFEFAALDFAAPEKIQFAYMLDGFDEQWNHCNAKRRFAVYTNLGEGKYIFKVKAANSDGLWNGLVKSMVVVIDPPWWKTGWAIVLYSVVLLASLYFFRRLILIRANFRHDIKLERLQRENMEKLNHAKLQFFTNISHEFRTPLTLILGPIQTLIDNHTRSKEERDQLTSVNINANRLLRLVNQLLDFRKAESGNLKLQVSEGNLVKFIKEIKLSFDALAEQMKIDFILTTTSGIIKAWFDPDQFEKIMFNLLSNAFKHTPESGRITIHIEERKEFISIVVEDNGKGIKREHFDSIFQTFFSYDEDKHHAGTGIGLAFVKSLVDMHHGKLEFESKENISTRFILQLPQGSSHFDASEISFVTHDTESMDHYPSLSNDFVFTPEEEVLLEEDSSTHLPTLLIVEDNDEVRYYIRSLFKDSYSILEAAQGEQGLSLAIERIPDVIISDVMMPVMDGIKLCAQLKSNMKTSHIPVLLLTARTSLIFKVEGLEQGADDYISKPFNPNVLKLKVRNLVHTRDVMRKMFQDDKLLRIEPGKVTLTPVDENFITSALEGIEKNMDNFNYSVDDLGRDVGMSRTQLYRKLKALTGQSANEFIRTIRLKRAAQLLDLDQLTIAEITHKVGFSDLQYFRDCFKKLFGVRPSEYVTRRRSEMTDNNS